MTLKEAIDFSHNNRDDDKLSLALRDSVMQRFEYTHDMA